MEQISGPTSVTAKVRRDRRYAPPARVWTDQLALLRSALTGAFYSALPR